MVTIIGTVTSCSDNSPESAETRHFTLESSVYDASTSAPARFSVDCFFENTKRWLRVKTPPPGTFLSITAKVAGRRASTHHLALRVLDLTYLPKQVAAAALAPTTPTTSPASKRLGRWEGRVAPSTPSKRPCLSAVGPEISPEGNAGPPPSPAQSGQESPSLPSSPSTVTYVERGSLASAGEPRPHRNRHPPKKYADAE